MAEYTRILLRQGPDKEKNNVILKSGEPAYITDYERIVVGDGVTLGGKTVGSKFLGFGSFDTISLEVFNVKPGYTGDLMFETTTNLLYVLSGTETILGKEAYQIKTNYLPINKTPAPDYVSIVNNGGVLSIALEGIDGRYIAGYALGNGLQKNSFNPAVIEMRQPSPELQFVEGILQIAEGGVTNDKLGTMRANSIKARLNVAGPPEDITFDDLKRSLGLVTEGGAVALGVPVGTIIDYGGLNAPANYFPCDGRELPINEFVELYSAIGDVWGQPSLSTFNIPNLNRRTTVGSGLLSGTGSSEVLTENVGSYGGLESNILKPRQLPPHVHKIDISIPNHRHTFTIDLPEVGGNYDAGSLIVNGFNNYITIINGNGPQVAPATTPNGPDANNILRSQASELIKANKPLLQQRVVDYVLDNFPKALSAFYTDSVGNTGIPLSAVCFRDSGYILDSYAADILNNTNHRSVETGNLYFSGFITTQKTNYPESSVPSLPVDQITPTVLAIEALGSFIAGVDMPISIKQYTNIGVLSSLDFFTPDQRVIVGGLSNFTNVISDSANIPSTTPINNEYLNNTYLSAAKLIEDNKHNLQQRVVEYVKFNFPYALSGSQELNSEQLSAKCFRDSGYIIDSIVADILNDANHRSVETGLFYFSGAVLARQNNNSDVPTLPQDQIFATIQAISSIGKFITGLTMPVENKYTTRGILSSDDFYTNSQLILLSGLDNFTKVINDFNNVPATTPGGNTGGDVSYEIAANLIKNNRANLQQQVVEYVKYYFPTALSGVNDTDSNSLSSKCFRDTGYIVDSMVADIINNANHRSVETGMFYFSGAVLARQNNLGTSVPTLPANQVDATIAAISAVSVYITGENVPLLPVPFTYAGVLSAGTGGETRREQVKDLSETIYYPLQSNGSSKDYLPAGNPSEEDINLSNTIINNRTSIQKSVSSYVYERDYFNIATVASQYDMLSSFNNFTLVITNSGNVPTSTPVGDTSDPDLQIAADLIAQRREILQKQVVEFVIYNYPNALSGSDITESSGLSSKCFRDTGFIVDSIVADLRNNANHRSVETGMFYFSGAVLARQDNPGSSVPTLPTNQVEATIAAISAVGSYITGNGIIVPPPSFTNFGILSSEGTTQKGKVWELIETMVYPLKFNGAQLPYSPAGIPIEENVKLGNLIISNKAKIQEEVAQYVLDNNYLTFNSITSAENTAKCNRDVGYMIDAVANDLITGVVSKSIQYAVAYWDGSTSRIPDSNIPNQTKNTLDVIEYLKRVSLIYANEENAMKCNRDVGFMIDAVANDLKTGVNAKSIQYAVAYWDGSTSRIPDSNIINQKANTLDVVEYLKSVSLDIAVNSSNIVSNLALKKVNNLVEVMVYPLENNGLTKPYEPQGNPSSTAMSVANKLISNKSSIQNRVTDYVVFRNYLQSNSDLLAKCRRDVGYMIDALVNDLITGVNAKSVQYALAYWDGSTSRLRELPGTIIQDQRDNTIDTINYLQSIILDTIATDNSSLIGEIMDLAKTMSYPLRNNGELPAYRPSGDPLTESRQIAASVLQKNRTLIQDRTRGYVESLRIISGTTPDRILLQEKCNRDVGYMIDSIINDLKTGVNARSIQFALSYWDGTRNRLSGNPAGSKLLPNGSENQIQATVATIRFLRDQCTNLVLLEGGGKTSEFKYTNTTEASGSLNYDGFTGSGAESLLNDPVSNIQPSAVVSKCIKYR